MTQAAIKLEIPVKPETPTTKVQSMYTGNPFPPVSREGQYTKFADSMKQLAVDNGFNLKNMKVLDAGCGTGVMIRGLAAAIPEASFTGIDLTDASLNIAKKIANEQGLKNITFQQDNLMDLKIGNNGESFDMIYSWGVLHHTTDTKQAFLNVVRLLKSGGIFRCGIYGDYGNRSRRDLRRIIDYFTEGKSFDEKISFVQEFLRNNPSFLDNYITEPSVDLNDRDYVADEFLHVHEIHYKLEEIAQWYKEAGLALVGLTDFYSEPISLDIKDYMNCTNGTSKENVSLDIIDRLAKPYWISLIGKKI